MSIVEQPKAQEKNGRGLLSQQRATKERTRWGEKPTREKMQERTNGSFQRCKKKGGRRKRE